MPQDVQIKLFSNQHAIELVAFTVTFIEPITTADIKRFDENSEELQSIFPSINVMNGIRVNFDRGEPQQLERASNARELADFARDGKKEWGAEFIDRQITLTCFKYSTWTEVRDAALIRLKALLKCVDEKKTISAIDLAFVDTFVSDISGDAYPIPKSFFRIDSEYVPKSIWDVEDARWDIKQGWFRDVGPDNECLVRLDVQASIRNREVVMNVQNIHSSRPKHTNMSVEQSFGSLSDIYDTFHGYNLNILRSLIRDDLLERMGLQN